MKFPSHHLRRTALSLGLLSIAHPGLAADIPANFPTLAMQGNVYRSVCTPDQLSQLRQAVTEGRPHAPAQLWRAVEVMLCSRKANSDVRFVRALVPRKIKRSSEATGDRTVINYTPRDVELIEGLFAEQKAWGAGVKVKRAKVTLQYFANEACVVTRTLIFVKPNWQISEFGEACD